MRRSIVPHVLVFAQENREQEDWGEEFERERTREQRGVEKGVRGRVHAERWSAACATEITE